MSIKEKELDNYSTIQLLMLKVIQTNKEAENKVNLILGNELLIEQGGDLVPANYSEKEKYLKIYEIYLDLVMEQVV